MKTSQISKTLIPALLLGFAIPAAQAQPGNGDGPGRQGPPPGGPRKERILEKFDADKDGQLSESERAAAKAEMEARKAADLKAYDKDGDGELSKAERQALGEAKRAERHAEILKKYDADKDGVLSEEERAKVREEMGPPPERRKEMRDQAKKRFDTDGDGVLSEAERAQAREQMQKRKGPKPGADRPAAE
jgi:hypothetical protein